MDYLVPIVDQHIEDGLNDMGGRYAAARAIQSEWEHMEVMDDRALSLVQDSIEYLVELKAKMESILDEGGEYNFSDRDEQRNV